MLPEWNAISISRPYKLRFTNIKYRVIMGSRGIYSTAVKSKLRWTTE